MPGGRNVLVNLVADTAGAEAKLRAVAAQVADFGRQQAEATLGVNTGALDAKVAGAETKVRDFGRLSAQAKIDLQITVAEGKLDALKAKLAELEKQPHSVDIDAKTAGVLLNIEKVKAELDTLRNKTVEVKVDVDRNSLRNAASNIKGVFEGGAFGVLKSPFTGIVDFAKQAGSAIQQAFSSATGAGGGLGQAVTGVVTAFAELAPVVLIGTAALVALVAVVTVLAGALVALVASLAAAAAGLAVIGTTLAVALGPAVLVAVGIVVRLAAAFKNAATAQTQQKAAAQAVTSALQSQTAAHTALINSQDQLKTAATAAYKAWDDAINQVAHDINSVKDAQLALEGSKLGIRDAEQALSDLRKQAGLAGPAMDQMFKKFTDVSFDPSKIRGALQGAVGQGGGAIGPSQELQLEHAILNVKTAKQGETDATQTLADAQKKLNDDKATANQYNQQGILANPAYVSALQNEQKAQVALTTATEKLAAARDKSNQTAKKTADVTPGEAGIVGTLKKAGSVLGDIFKPVEAPVFAAVKGLIADLERFAKNPAIAGAFKSIGISIGGFVSAFGKMVSSRDFASMFARLAEGGAKLLTVLGSRIFLDFVTLLTRIADRALPAVLTLFRVGAGDVHKFVTSLTNRQIDTFIKGVINSFKSWWNLIRSVFNLLVSLFSPAKGAGDSMVNSLSKTFDRWANWLSTHKVEVKKFFDDCVQGAKDLGSFFAAAIGVLKTLIPVAQAVWAVVGPIFKAVSAYQDMKKAQDEAKKKEATDAPTTRAAIQKIQDKPASQRTPQDVQNLSQLQRQLGAEQKQLPKRSAAQQALDAANREIQKIEQKKNRSREDLINLAAARQRAREAQREVNLEHVQNTVQKMALGGLVLGGDYGDSVPAMLTPGEFVIRRQIAQSIGVGNLHALNTGRIPAAAAAGAGGAGGMHIEHQHVNLPAAPGHDQLGDPRHQAVMFAREMKRRAGGMI
jgi:hypothetical protein